MITIVVIHVSYVCQTVNCIQRMAFNPASMLNCFNQTYYYNYSNYILPITCICLCICFVAAFALCLWSFVHFFDFSDFSCNENLYIVIFIQSIFCFVSQLSLLLLQLQLPLLLLSSPAPLTCALALELDGNPIHIYVLQFLSLIYVKRTHKNKTHTQPTQLKHQLSKFISEINILFGIQNHRRTKNNQAQCLKLFFDFLIGQTYHQIPQ